MWRELLRLLEACLFEESSAESPREQRDSKQAVLKHFGVFKDDNDLEHWLAGIHARRKARNANPA